LDNLSDALSEASEHDDGGIEHEQEQIKPADSIESNGCESDDSDQNQSVADSSDSDSDASDADDLIFDDNQMDDFMDMI